MARPDRSGTFVASTSSTISSMVAALEATWGHVPALMFHDYGGTILVIGWLFVFWTAVQRWIVVAPAPSEEELSAA